MGFAGYEVLAAFDLITCRFLVVHEWQLFHDDRIGYVQPAQGFYNQAASLVARGAAEETYAYFSSVQMAAYSMGYPIIVGSHNAHRVKALRDVGGFAAHDADDLLLTLNYRTRDWEGVYVPRILARGLTPVDWNSYLTQQRRWARSVLDIKLKRWEGFSGRLPTASRVMSFLHGINFLHRAAVFLGAFGLLLYCLGTGQPFATHDRRMLGPAVFLLVVLGLQERFRQRFYIGRDERGLHWRASLLEYAKWPWFVVAVWDVLTARSIPYVITRKTSAKARIGGVVPVNAAIVVLVALAWLIGRTQGPTDPISATAGLTFVILSLVVIATALIPAPPPFQPGLWAPSHGGRSDRNPPGAANGPCAG